MKKIISCLILLFTLFSFSLLNVKASTYLDLIENYEITVDPNSDGTLDMDFYIKWKVLNDNIEGPLEWIKVGIPNKFVTNISGKSNNIKKINYYSDNGSFIRIDLDRKYYSGEVIEIRFSYTQSRMYILSKNECYYDYKPGWFDEIPVNKAVVKWNADGVIDSNSSSIENGYYIYESALKPGETITVDVKYNNDYFRVLNPDLQYTDEYMTITDYIAITLVVLILIVVIVVLITSIISQYDPYLRERGFIGRGYFYHPRRYRRRGYYSSGRRIEKPSVVNSSAFKGGSGGSSCACACACACAGGGRAGCSMKDFYKHPNLEQIKKALD